MNAAPRSAPRQPLRPALAPLPRRYSRPASRRVRAADQPLSDMAAELLATILAGLRQRVDLDAENEALLGQFLQARGPADASFAARVGLPEAELRARLAAIFAATGTQTRRQLLTLGLALARS